jgi:hypothetical protein
MERSSFESWAGLVGCIIAPSTRTSPTAFQGLRCHPPTCMLLKIRLIVDSSPASGVTVDLNEQTP